MKWKEFKDAVEAQGVNDLTDIRYIDWSDSFFSDKPYVRKQDNNEISIE